MKQSEIKSNVVVFLLLGVWLFFFLRLGYVQIFKKGYYSQESKKQNIERIIVYPERGKIFDRFGKVIATNIKTKTLIALPRKIREKKKTAKLLSAEGLGEYSKIYNDLNRKKFFYIKRNIEYPVSREITKTEGIEFLQDRKRFYPNGRLCSSLVGFVGTEYTGLEGLEFEFDSLLAGKPGWAYLQKTPGGLLYPHPALPRKSARGGKNIVLTVDIDVQSIVLSELEKVIKSTSAKRGIVVVINPKTGEILALVNLPDYNPNKFLKYDKELWTNPAISELFEPGSTFKIVTATAAINENLYKLNELVENGEGAIKIGRVKITDAEKHGPLTFVEFIEHSSNVAAIKIAGKVGKKKFYCYLRSFGFGSQTKIKLPGEETGYVGKPYHWTPLKFATMSFGQGLSVTAMQLVYAYGAVANGGVLLKPSVVRYIVTDDGDTVYSSNPVVIRRVMKKETAKILNDILVGVVNHGTGKYAKLDGIEIAGKTGTAEKSKPGTGYEKDEYVASFIGYLPAGDPQLLIGVFIDEPKGLHWGGYVAAPLFRKIAKRIICLDDYNDKIFNSLYVKNLKLGSNEVVKNN